MFILNDILSTLRKEFSSTDLGRERSHLFTYTILAFIIPFTTSISSNVFRCINTLFGLNVNKRRFYIFMASDKPPRDKLWRILWGMIPNPLSDGRLLAALDDFINHVNFSMMAATIAWIYGTRLENIPERRHKVRGRNIFAFSDLRHIIAKAALSDDFNAVCNKEQKLSLKSFVDVLLRMVG